MEWFTNFIIGIFGRDLLLVIFGSWLTVMVQVFGLRGPLRKLIVDALKQERRETDNGIDGK